MVIIDRIAIGADRTPPGHRAIPGGAAGAAFAALEVVEGHLVGIDIAAACTALDGHVADGHALLHRHRVDGRAIELIGIADPALGGQGAQDVEDDILGVDAGLERAIDLDAPHLEPAHRQRLGGQHVAHLAGADAEGDGAEGAVGRGMAVTAGHRHARLGQAHLGGDDVHHALLARTRLEQADAIVAAVALDGDHHVLRQAIGVGAGLVLGRDDVVHSGDRAFGERHAQALVAQVGERLRAGDLMDHVQADEELGLTARQIADGMQVPDFVEQRALAHSAATPWQEDPRWRPELVLQAAAR